jgi:hypothetical protein
MKKDVRGIGQINEYTIHSELKTLYGSDGAEFEKAVGGYIVDVVRDDLLIEIQTAGFFSVKEKLQHLIKEHEVRLVYPLPAEKHLLIYDQNMEKLLYRRRSPKKGTYLDIVDEIIYILPVLLDTHFILEVLLTKEEEVRIFDGRGSWRRRGISIHDRKLVKIIETRTFYNREDYKSLLPEDIPSRFTNRNLSELMGIPRSKAGKLTYCFRRLDILNVCGKEGNAHVFTMGVR